MLKVLLQARSDGFTKYGGDTTQLLHYRELLKKYNCELTISTSLFPDLEYFDLYHVINIDMPYELYAQIKRARKYGIPVALMTIHHRNRYLDEYYRWFASIRPSMRILMNGKARELVKLLLRKRTKDHLLKVVGSVPVYKKLLDIQRYCLENVQTVLLSAEKELEALSESFNCNVPSPVVIPNAGELVSQNLTPLQAASLVKMNLPEEYGVVIGRVEPRKNQVMVLESIRNIDFPVLFFGAASPVHGWYCKMFESQLGTVKHANNMGFVERHLLSEILRRAKLCIAASWFEVAPISSFDAFLAGCSVTTTTHSYAYEYLGTDVSYCDPSSIESIKSSIINALDHTAPRQAIEEFKKKYNWEQIGQSLFKAYASII